MRTRPLVLACWSILLPLLSALSASAQVPPVFEGEEVVVAGRRPQPVVGTPTYVTVLGGEELRRLGFLTVGEALRLLAEVYVREAYPGPGGLLQPSIRGTSPLQVLVLLDGVPLNPTAQFGVNLATLPLAEVERIEVLRGPYSALWGSGALGGVIHVITRRPERARISAGYGSFDTAQAHLSLGGGSEALRYGLGAELLTTGGFLPNGDARRLTATGRISLPALPMGDVELSFHHTDGRSGLPGPSFLPTPSDRQSDWRTVAGLTWRRGEPNLPEHLFRMWWYGEGLAYTSPGYGSDARGSAYGANWQRILRLPTGALLTLGAEWQGASYRFQDSFGGYAADDAALSGYGQVDLALLDRTLLGVGARLDLHRTWGMQLNPRLGFVHFLGPGVRVRGSVGRTFRGPTFGERFFPGCSDPNLRPESAWSLDLGMEAEVREGLLVRLNGFYTDSRDLITGGCPPQNIGSARIQGLSAEAVGRLGDRWSVLGNLTWSDGLDRTTGLPLLRVPGWTANLALRYEVSPQSSLTLVAHYVGERPDLDYATLPPNRILLPSYLTLGLRYEIRWRNWTVQAVVDNLLDARYETLRGYPAPGRSVYLRFGGSF
ncbi:MAG: TonB-dependent receptor [Armatimonadetes bacterium]|nr:TonB-dependent receptor [Armatimonadota bacterium]MDW8154513.1 TonB-dependent receptor [Armatimonadota bacterium]